MTKSASDRESGESTLGRCRWCRRVVVQRPGPGRPKQFCGQKCRQWDWVSRQRGGDLQLEADEIIISRSELDRLHDDLYTLTCAVEDVERDLASKRPTNAELSSSMNWLLQAARPLVNRDLSGPEIQPH